MRRHQHPNAHTGCAGLPWLPRRLALAAVMLLPGLAAAAEGDANVLQTRATVAAMVEESIEMLEGQVSLEGVAGWAVFSGDPLSADLPAGVGMAERIDGEAHFLRTPDPGCLSAGYRHVLVFRDEDLFREFRQGELQGEALERSRSEAPEADLLAFRFRPGDSPRLEPLDLGACSFALYRDLQRALVAEPSETEGLVEEGQVEVDDN